MRSLFVTLFATLAFVLTMSSSAYAQLARGQVFNVEADHDGVDTDFYDVKIDGALVKTVTVAEAFANGVARVTGLVAASQAGSHLITMTARNSDGRIAESDPLAFSVLKGQPAKPGKPRITTSNQAGNVSVRMPQGFYAIPRNQEIEIDPTLRVSIHKRK